MVKITRKAESSPLDVPHSSKTELSIKTKNHPNKRSQFLKTASKTHNCLISPKVRHFPIRKSKSTATETAIKEMAVSLIKAYI
jgi:hypothetical protein